MQYLSEQNVFIFLIQLFLLLGLAMLLGELFRIWKQPTITAEILAGILLGPTILGRFSPALYQSIFPRIIARTMGDNKTQRLLMAAADQQGIWQILQEAFTTHQVVRETNRG